MQTVAHKVNGERGEFFLKEIYDYYRTIGYTEEEAKKAIDDFKNECEKYN